MYVTLFCSIQIYTSLPIVFSNRTNLYKSANIPPYIVILVTIEANVTSVSIPFNITDDLVALEEDEDYELRLELVTIDPRVSVASPDESTLVILDDDGELNTLYGKNLEQILQYIYIYIAVIPQSL